MNLSPRTLTTPEETELEAQRFVDTLQPHATGATLVTLSGDLGAGKTTFTQSVAKAFGITEIVNSPTFVIEKIYAIPQESSADSIETGGISEKTTALKFTRLVHIDAYRLQSAEDLAVLGFEEIMSHSGTLILLEWPERVAGIEERAAAKTKLEHAPDGTRHISYA